MKNFLKLTFIFTLLLTIQSNAQLLDTLNYLKQFETNKTNYIGQPFSKLLNDMTQIQPNTALVYPIKNKRSMIKSTAFKFCKMDYSFHNAITLYITWQNDISTNQAQALGTQNHYYFINDEKTFYGNKIIKDIRVYRR